MSNMDTNAPSENAGRSFHTLMQELVQDISSLQQPSDIITLMTHSMSLLSAIRISIEAGVFRHLASSPSPVSLGDLIRDVGIGSDTDSKQDVVEKEEFLSRLLRAVRALKLADETGPSVYQANELITALAHPGFEAGWKFMFENREHTRSDEFDDQYARMGAR